MSLPATGPRRRARGFTLVELLVVIGIIALLMSILLPTLGRVREQAQRTKCMSQARELGRAVFSYQNAHNGFMPFANWDDGKLIPAGFKVGWLYQLRTSPEAAQSPAEVEEGAFWPYIGNRAIYHCPAHEPDQYMAKLGTTEVLTSYLMNGAISNYEAKKHYKFNQFLRWQDGIMIWEADERLGSAWNDGASYPWESFDPSASTATGYRSRHGKGSCGIRLDGGVDYYNQDDYFKWASDAKTNQAVAGFQNQLWYRPK